MLLECVSPSASLTPFLSVPFRADRFVRELGLGSGQGHMGSLAHGDSEVALCEEGAQAGVNDRTGPRWLSLYVWWRRWGICCVGVDQGCEPGEMFVKGSQCRHWDSGC